MNRELSCARLNKEQQQQIYRACPANACLPVGPLSRRGRARATRSAGCHAKHQRHNATVFHSAFLFGVGGRKAEPSLPLPDSEKPLSLLRTHGTAQGTRREAGAPRPAVVARRHRGLCSGARGGSTRTPRCPPVRSRPCRRGQRGRAAPVPSASTSPLPCHAIIKLACSALLWRASFLAGDGNMFTGG